MAKEYTLHLLQEKFIEDQWKDTPHGKWDFGNPLTLSVDKLEFEKEWHTQPDPNKIPYLLDLDKRIYGHKIRDLRWVKVTIQIS